MNQWAASGEMQDEERYIRSVFGTLVTNRARCFEHLFAFFFKEILVTARRENCSSQGVKEQKQGFLCRLWTDDGGWN